MKSIFGMVFFVVIVGVLVSCASTPHPKTRPLQQGEQVIGTVQTTMEIGGLAIILDAAYGYLLETAKKEYNGNIDIRDITTAYLGRAASLYKFSAIGKVISLDNENSKSTATGVEGALARAAEQTLKNVPAKSKIAIVYITAQDRSTTEYVVGELEYIWVNQGYFITDRSQLDRLRREQNFQMSGEVDDETAVSIGKFAGASIIVTGRVDGEGNLRRLRLRALDTQTAQVVGVSSERL
jgi:hypothetical protein